MQWDGWFTLAIVVMIFVALARNWAPPDVLLMGGTLLVCLVGILTPADAFSGIANEGVLTVAALFVVAAGLRETGALEAFGSRILGSRGGERAAILRLSVPVIGISAFLNNTPVVAMLIGVVSDWCRRRRISPSKLMLPLSYLAILGGTCTLIGTSTNLVVDGMMRQRSEALADDAAKQSDPQQRERLLRQSEQIRGMGLFEISKIGLPYAAVGVLYLVLFGRRLLPDRQDLLERIGESRREYMADMLIQPGCRLIGQRIEDAGLRRLPGLFLIEVVRQGQSIAPVGPDFVLAEGDRLTFTGVLSTIVDLERIPGFVPAVDDAYETKEDVRREQRLCEAVMSPTSPLVGKNIREANFRAFYNAAVVAVHRGGQRLRGKIGDIVLQPGDTLLLQSGSHFAEAHRNDPDFYLVRTIDDSRPVRHERSWYAMGLLLVLIVLMASGWIEIVTAAFLIAGLMIVTRCLSASVARQNIDMQVLVTIAGALGLAQALEKTGAAATIAHFVVGLTRDLGPLAALLTVYLMAGIFTELITNNAAAALMFPFAVAIADDLGVSPRPFVMAVTFAASASFATPIGYQTNMMVFGPGGYRFSDFLRVGIPLNIVLWIFGSLMIPLAWPF